MQQLSSRSNPHHSLAVDHLAAKDNTAPSIVFCGGFHSCMQGNKAIFLKNACIVRGWGFTRFDYRGHGNSDGEPSELGIRDWLADTLQVIDWLETPQILIGSSMGGWLAALAQIARPEKIAALITIAAAPDFPSELLWPSLSAQQQKDINNGNDIKRQSHYDESYWILNKRLFDSAKDLSLLSNGQAKKINCPIHLLHGTKDVDIPHYYSSKLFESVSSTHAMLTLVKNTDHRFSKDIELNIIENALTDMVTLLSANNSLKDTP